jgi:hypothetical protein
MHTNHPHCGCTPGAMRARVQPAACAATMPHARRTHVGRSMPHPRGRSCRHASPHRTLRAREHHSMPCRERARRASDRRIVIPRIRTLLVIIRTLIVIIYTLLVIIRTLIVIICTLIAIISALLPIRNVITRIRDKQHPWLRVSVPPNRGRCASGRTSGMPPDSAASSDAIFSQTDKTTNSQSRSNAVSSTRWALREHAALGAGSRTEML